MTCKFCADLSQTVEVRTKRALIKTIAVVNANIDDGTLTAVGTVGIDGREMSKEFLNLSGPWPDYIDHSYVCSRCGQEFRLQVETYHGVGGVWLPRIAES